MQVRRDDGITIHIGPQPIAVPKGGGQELIGSNRPAISLVQIDILGADAVAKANSGWRDPKYPTNVEWRNLWGVSPLTKSFEAFPMRKTR